MKLSHKFLSYKTMGLGWLIYSVFQLRKCSSHEPIYISSVYLELYADIQRFRRYNPDTCIYHCCPIDQKSKFSEETDSDSFHAGSYKFVYENQRNVEIDALLLAYLEKDLKTAMNTDFNAISKPTTKCYRKFFIRIPIVPKNEQSQLEDITIPTFTLLGIPKRLIARYRVVDSKGFSKESYQCPNHAFTIYILGPNINKQEGNIHTHFYPSNRFYLHVSVEMSFKKKYKDETSFQSEYAGGLHIEKVLDIHPSERLYTRKESLKLSWPKCYYLPGACDDENREQVDTSEKASISSPKYEIQPMKSKHQSRSTNSQVIFDQHECNPQSIESSSGSVNACSLKRISGYEPS